MSMLLALNSGGEPNIGANVGAGAGVYKGKSGFLLNFKSIIVDTSITLTNNTDDVTLGVNLLDDDTFATATDDRAASAESVKAYVDTQIASALSSEMSYKGGYDAATNTPDLDITPIAVNKGDVYVVTVAGNFFTEAVEVGDMLIAEIDSAAAIGDWTVVQANLTPATIKSQYESNADTNAFTDALLSKLNGIEALADVTDEANVTAALDGATLTAVSAATIDKVLIQDQSDSDILKTATAQDIANQLGALTGIVDTQGYTIRSTSDALSTAFQASSGANATGIAAYGGSHATKPGDLELYSKTLALFVHDASAKSTFMGSGYADGTTEVGGNATAGTGPNLKLYGSSHATKAGDWELRSNGSTVDMWHDYSAQEMGTRWLLKHTPVTVDGAASLTKNRHHFVEDSGGGNYAITAPDDTNATDLFSIHGDPGLTETVTLNGYSGGTIGGQTSMIVGPNDYLLCRADGSNWDILLWERGPRLINRVYEEDEAEPTTTSSSFVDSGISVTINPVTKGSKVTITVSALLSSDAASHVELTLYRKINGGSATDLTPGTRHIMAVAIVSSAARRLTPFLQFEDDHGGATGDSIEYLLYFRTSGGTAYIGDTSSGGKSQATTMIAEEYI